MCSVSGEPSYLAAEGSQGLFTEVAHFVAAIVLLAPPQAVAMRFADNPLDNPLDICSV